MHLIKAEAARLSSKTDGPVIAAGSTGSIPSTAELIATIAHLPHGAVVLPGLDTDLDEASWRLISGDPKKKIAAVPGHPQFAMQALLTRIGIPRSAVDSLAKADGREGLLSEAMRPAMQTDVWWERASDLVFAAQADAAVSTVTVIEAASAEEEALSIAIALREAVQDGKPPRWSHRTGAGTPCRRGADALEYRGGRYRRCSACRNTGRDFCPNSRRKPPSPALNR